MPDIPRIPRILTAFILIFLWGTVIEDTLIFVMTWIWPDFWFIVFHNAAAAGSELPLLRRTGGHWFALALVQAITLWRWRREPVWLAVTAGARFSDLFTDASYLIASPSLTPAGWILFPLLPLLNLAGVVVMLHGYRLATGTRP
jgi:hypothetical protein